MIGTQAGSLCYIRPSRGRLWFVELPAGCLKIYIAPHSEKQCSIGFQPGSELDVAIPVEPRAGTGFLWAFGR
jgi:hypothetical protein